MHVIPRHKHKHRGGAPLTFGVARPGLTTSEDDTRKILARFNGTGPDADQYGRELLGLYKAFEKYHAPLRNQ